MLQALFNAGLSPRLRFLYPDRPTAFEFLGHGQQALSGIGTAVEQHVFHRVTQLCRNIFVDRQLPRIDDPHVHASADRVKEKCRVHRFTDCFVSAKRKRDIGHATRHMGVR